jgi:hypothetical protein
MAKLSLAGGIVVQVCAMLARARVFVLCVCVFVVRFARHDLMAQFGCFNWTTRRRWWRNESRMYSQPTQHKHNAQLYCAGAAVWTLFLLVALYHELKRDQVRVAAVGCFESGMGEGPENCL